MTPDVTVSAAMAPAEKTSEAVDHPATQLLRCYRTRDARGTVRTALNHWHSPIIHDHEEKRSMLMAESLESAPVLDYPLSLAFALSTEAMPHFCYANAWHVFNSLANWSDVSSLVEGWMVLEQTTRISLIEHAWCTCGNRLLDPSIVLLFPKNQWDSLFYLPGVSYSHADLQGVACRDLPVVCSCGRFGSDGMGHPVYRAAYERGYHQAVRLSEACSPPKPLSIHPSFPPASERARRRLVVQVVSSRAIGHTESWGERKSISQRKQKAGDDHAHSYPDTGL